MSAVAITPFEVQVSAADSQTVPIEWNGLQFRLWINKRHPIPCPNKWAMRCFCEDFRENWSHLMALHCMLSCGVLQGCLMYPLLSLLVWPLISLPGYSNKHTSTSHWHFPVLSLCHATAGQVRHETWCVHKAQLILFFFYGHSCLSKRMLAPLIFVR